MFMQSEDPAAIVVCHHDGETMKAICDHLATDGYEALRAPTAEEALRFCRYNQPDLMILDEELPDLDGIEVLRAIRQADGIVARYDPNLPIVVVTDRDDDDGRDRAFDEGADDFLARRVSYSEFKARIAAVLRRSSRRGDSEVRVGELVIDAARWRVLVGEREVRLTKLEFRLLRMLASDPTRVFSKDELLSAVWGERRPLGKTRTVDSHLSRLRRKLDPDHGTYVSNCWGIGYRLVDA
jgi:two-component system response regulator VicR